MQTSNLCRCRLCQGCGASPFYATITAGTFCLAVVVSDYGCLLYAWLSGARYVTMHLGLPHLMRVSEKLQLSSTTPKHTSAEMSWDGRDDPRSDSPGSKMSWRAGSTEEGVPAEEVELAAIHHIDALHEQNIQAPQTKRVTGEDGGNRGLMGPDKVQVEQGKGNFEGDDTTRLERTGVLLHLDMSAQEILASPALIQVTPSHVTEQSWPCVDARPPPPLPLMFQLAYVSLSAQACACGLSLSLLCLFCVWRVVPTAAVCLSL